METVMAVRWLCVTLTGKSCSNVVVRSAHGNLRMQGAQADVASLHPLSHVRLRSSLLLAGLSHVLRHIVEAQLVHREVRRQLQPHRRGAASRPSSRARCPRSRPATISSRRPASLGTTVSTWLCRTPETLSPPPSPASGCSWSAGDIHHLRLFEVQPACMHHALSSLASCIADSNIFPFLDAYTASA